MTSSLDKTMVCHLVSKKTLLKSCQDVKFASKTAVNFHKEGLSLAREVARKSKLRFRHKVRPKENLNEGTRLDLLHFKSRGCRLKSRLCCLRLQLTRIDNYDLLTSSTGLASNLFNRFDNAHAFGYSSKHYMLAVKPRRLCSCQKELAPIGVST